MARKEIGWHLEEYWHRPDFLSKEKKDTVKVYSDQQLKRDAAWRRKQVRRFGALDAFTP